MLKLMVVQLLLTLFFYSSLYSSPPDHEDPFVLKHLTNIYSGFYYLEINDWKSLGRDSLDGFNHWFRGELEGLSRGLQDFYYHQYGPASKEMILFLRSDCGSENIQTSTKLQPTLQNCLQFAQRSGIGIKWVNFLNLFLNSEKSFTILPQIGWKGILYQWIHYIALQRNIPLEIIRRDSRSLAILDTLQKEEVKNLPSYQCLNFFWNSSINTIECEEDFLLSKDENRVFLSIKIGSGSYKKVHRIFEWEIKKDPSHSLIYHGNHVAITPKKPILFDTKIALDGENIPYFAPFLPKGEEDQISANILERVILDSINRKLTEDERRGLERSYSVKGEKGNLYLKTPYFENVKIQSHGSAYSRAEMISYFRDITHGLMTLNEKLQFIHNDIKPENMMIYKKNGNKKECILIDYGLAQPIIPSEKKQSLNLAGTPGYFSPEKILNIMFNHQNIDLLYQSKIDLAKSDLFSLVISFYEIMVGSNNEISQCMAQYKGDQWNANESEHKKYLSCLYSQIKILKIKAKKDRDPLLKLLVKGMNYNYSKRISIKDFLYQLDHLIFK